MRVQNVLLPGILLAMIVMVALTSLMAGPEDVARASKQAFTSGVATVDEAFRTGLTLHLDRLLTTTREDSPAVKTSKPKAEKTVKKETQEEAQPAATHSGDCSLSSSYPDGIRQWCDLIERSASEYGVEANLIAAVMLQESGGDSQAYSHSGAVGLMQVMPRDGLAAAFMCGERPCFASRPSMDELYDPAFNIDYGARMLAGLIERRGGVRDALMSYGPMDVGYYYADKVLAIYTNYQ